MSSRSRPGPPSGEPYGPHPGPEDYRPPADPWGQATDAWGQPTSGWGPPTQPARYPESGHPAPPYADPPYAAPPYRGSPYGEPGYPPSPPGLPPAGPQPPRRNLGMYAVVTVLVVLAAVGVGYALYVLSGDDGGSTAAPDPGPVGATGSPGPSASPRDKIGLSAAVAEVGDCLVNDGTTDQTQMRIVRCDEDAAGVVFRVLAVIDERVQGEDDDARLASAQSICASTEGYTHHYFEVGEQSSFVLCLAEPGG